MPVVTSEHLIVDEAEGSQQVVDDEEYVLFGGSGQEFTLFGVNEPAEILIGAQLINEVLLANVRDNLMNVDDVFGIRVGLERRELLESVKNLIFSVSCYS